jgi:hypothetical protein
MKTQISAARALARTLAVLAVSAGLTSATVPTGALGAPTRAAKPPAGSHKLGAVQQLQASVDKPGADYRVTGTWTALAGAAGYNASLVDSATGTVLDKAKLTDPTWAAHTTKPALTQVSVKVVPLTATGRRGRQAITTAVLPDVTAPVGSYSVSHDPADDAVVTVTEVSLSDDVSAAAAVTREIRWDEGAAFEVWPTGGSVTNTYSADLALHNAEVRLTDPAGNVATVPLTIAVNDNVAPQGEFTAGPATAWAKRTKVKLTQVSLADNLSTAENIKRVVIWKDGTKRVIWAPGTTLRHVYRKAGTFSPTIRLVDEAGNKLVETATAVTVKADTTAPTVRVRVPKTHLSSADSWRTLRGTARDGVGVGVAKVSLKAVQKRGASWFAYRPASRTWVKAGATKGAALRKAGVAAVRPGTKGSWSYRLGRLRKGHLVFSAVGHDRVGNTSATVWTSRSLTR